MSAARKTESHCTRCREPVVFVHNEREIARPCEPREALIRTDVDTLEGITVVGRDGETYTGERITGVGVWGLDHGSYVTGYPLHTPGCPDSEERRKERRKERQREERAKCAP